MLAMIGRDWPWLMGHGGHDSFFPFLYFSFLVLRLTHRQRRRRAAVGLELSLK